MEEMVKIFNIYGSNAFLNGVYLKMSRLNHSCRPNAEICSDSDVSKPLNIRAMSKIEAGEEIVISYKFALVSMNRQCYEFSCNVHDLIRKNLILGDSWLSLSVRSDCTNLVTLTTKDHPI